MLAVEIDGDPREVLTNLGAEFRSSPMGDNLAAYLDRDGNVVVVIRTGIRGVAPEHEAVVADCLVRMLRDADDHGTNQPRSEGDTHEQHRGGFAEVRDP